MRTTRPSLPIETTILRALLESEGGFVSGAALARQLNLSRVAVWQHMEKMRQQGFAFEAVRARGYRLAQRPTGLHPDLIRAFLAPRRLRFDWVWLESVDSTNDEVTRRLADGALAPLVVVAKEQTRGRGRFGRKWHSEANGNLYISFGFRPELDHARMQTFTLWMGACICDLIATFARTTPSLKWPNDILFDGRKAGGILTEARIDADQIRELVFGLGLNLDSASGAWPEDLARRAISLREHLQADLDVNKFTAALIGRVLDSYDLYLQGKHTPLLAERWQRYDALRHKTVTLLQGPHRITGTALGIDDEGSLLLRNAQGRTERFRAGEVTLEKPLTQAP